MEWRRKTEISNERVDELAKELDIHSLLARILLNRDYDTNSARVITKDLHEAIIDPSLLTNALEVAKLIATYCRNKNAEIFIFADYDLDGMTSGFIAKEGLEEVAECPVNVHFPNRCEGYGIHMDFAKKIVDYQENTNKDVLVITVDNGISRAEEIKYLKDRGIEVIVTDHHVAQEEVPECLIVDPHNHNEPDTFKHLAGCGVIFKVIQLVMGEFNVEIDMMKYLPFVAIGTIADMMPLTEENIAFILYGLEVMNSDDCPNGIKEFKRFTGKKKLIATDIGWELAPRLNSCGRLGDTQLGAQLFFSKDEAELEDIMLSIESMNIARKSYSDKAKKLMKNLTFDNDEVCIINATEYPEGVVGIVAGEAQKVFSKPAIVLVEKDGKLTGSVRSSKGIDLQEILKKEQDKGNIVSFGGHAAAAGVTIEEGKLDEFRESLNKELIEMLENMEYIEEELIIDELIEIEHINESTFDIINQLPYDNRTFMSPTFALTDVEVTSTKTSKNNPNNICFTIKDECGKKIDLWAWSMAKQYEEMGKPKKMHIAGQIERNFMNPKYFTLKVIDFMGA